MTNCLLLVHLHFFHRSTGPPSTGTGFTTCLKGALMSGKDERTTAKLS